jgi:AcrR family transcriptional regulator
MKPVKTAKKSPGRPRSAASEKAILDATLELLKEEGYGGLTTDKVALRAGASKSTMYRRWPSKQHLVIAAFDSTPELNIPDSGDLYADMYKVIKEYIGILNSTTLSGVLPALIGERAHNADLAAVLDPLIARRSLPINTVLRKAVERGELPAKTNCELAGTILMSPIQMNSELGRSVNTRMIKPILNIVLPGLGYSKEAY